MAITAADVKKLREATGAGMMDCKNALTETEGDFEKAVDWLRKKGQKVADKRSNREANEGYVLAKTNTDKTFAAVFTLNCETDFVAKNNDFVQFANKLMDLVMEHKPANIEAFKALSLEGRTVADHINEMVGKIGEKIDLNEYHIIEAPAVFAYNHYGNRLATIMGLNKTDVTIVEQIGKEVNMQIAAMAPIAISKDDVDEATKQHELEIGKEQARQEGKPEAMLEKIAIGKLNKFFKEKILLNQDFVRDNKMTVGQYLASHDKTLAVTSFYRVSLAD
ncbi:MAG: translation elongation factor Ts [Bacteroidales bacterium]|nr:translation elongation factor Ts [Bacteroidales bacterium]